MGVYIPGMEMPKDCDECWKKYHGFGMVEHDEEWGTFYCKLAKGFCVDPRTKCPLVPVPPHGRLIDGDELMEHPRSNHPAIIHGIRMSAKAAPTIIPAEEEKRCSQ